MTTTTPKKENLEPEWHLIDAEGKVLGRVASDIAKLLIGKHKPLYTPNINVGDKVIVINAEKFVVTGTKMQNKLYKRHTGYPGAVREESLKNLTERSPEKVVTRAVGGMLPKNKLRKVRLSNLYVYPGSEHPHTGQIKSN